jgi:predicted nucleotidyltransferase
MIEKILDKMKEFDVVEAIVLGGSRATEVYDDHSDYDFYVYLKEPLDEQKRREVLEPYVKYMEFSNAFWELEDDGILINGVEIELIYRTIELFDKMLENVFIKGNVSIGYTTCFVDNLLRSKIVFDKNNRFKELQNKYKVILKDWNFSKIIHHNFPILMDHMPSLYYQVEKAVKRNDIYAINHRSTAYFESYFDILFALNKTLHPGEKRILEIASNLPKIPVDMKQDITTYFQLLHHKNNDALKQLEKISYRLHDLLTKNGFVLSIHSFQKNA